MEKQIHGCQGLERGWRWEEENGLYKGSMRDPYSDGNVL